MKCPASGLDTNRALGSHRPAAAETREALEEWALNVVGHLSDAEPDFPQDLSDRQWDLWEPLFAIADLTGSSTDARKAAVALHAGAYNDTSAGLLALEHSRAMFNGHEA